MSLNPCPTRPTVLCIDDSLLVRKTIAMILGKHVELWSAATAEEGLALARARHPNLVVTDIHMPGMDGYAMLQALKADPATRHLPVVALTSACSAAERERGMAAGFMDYVSKSADLSALMRLVAELTRHQDLPAAAAVTGATA